MKVKTGRVIGQNKKSQFSLLALVPRDVGRTNGHKLAQNDSILFFFIYFDSFKITESNRPKKVTFRKFIFFKKKTMVHGLSFYLGRTVFSGYDWHIGLSMKT